MELSGENQNLSYNDQRKVKQMLRGIFISKIRNNKIDLSEVNDIVKKINSRLNFSEEIPDEEYYFSYMISDEYPKNLKLRMPIFEPLDVFYLFYKYDKEKRFKLGEIFNGINCNFGGINDIAETIMKKDDYENMVEISEKMGQLFYQNISGNGYPNDENLDIVIFLQKESEKEISKSKKDLYDTIASCLSFIKLFQDKIFITQKKNKKDYEFILDDFYNLLNDKKKLNNCSNIFKKEKEAKDTDKNKNLFSPSFIYYINNNQTIINNLFLHLNNSHNSIISDLNKERKIDYLPFWLYILRNISSLNCIEYGKKEMGNLAIHIADKIKKKISYSLNKDKTLSLKWLNLLMDNISSEILEPKIHLFYNYFNSLVNNLNITGKNLKSFALNELEEYYYKIIDSVFNDSIDKLLDENLIEDKKNDILKFTENPSFYLYEKIKADINSKFIDIMNKENIYTLNKNFNDKIFELSEILINEINEANKKLFENEFQKLKDELSKSVSNEFSNLCKCNSNLISSIDKILTKKEFGDRTTKAISEDEHNNLSILQNQISKYKKFGLKEKEEGRLTYFSLEYDFTKIKDKKFDLLYIGKYIDIENDNQKGIIFIISDKNDEEFKNKFKIKLLDEPDEEQPAEDVLKKKEEKDEEGHREEEEQKEEEGEEEHLVEEEKKEEGEEEHLVEEEKKEEGEEEHLVEEEKKEDPKDKIDVRKKEKDKYIVENFIDFKKAKKFVFSKCEIGKEEEEEIKKSIEKGLKVPSESDVKNPPEILLSKYKVNEFSEYINKLKESSNSLLNIFKEIENNKINNKEIIENLETKIKEVSEYIDTIKEMLKLNKNDFEELNNASKDLDKEISEFNSNLNKFSLSYQTPENNSVKDILSEFFNIEENNIFSLDFSLPSIPKSISKSAIHLDRMNKDSENLCVPIINVDSEGKNLICCYKSLELNLGKTCPALYYKPYIINIISFVNEDMTIKVKFYKEKKIDKKDDKEDGEEKNKKEEEGGEEEEDKEEEKEKEEAKIKEEKPIAVYDEENNNRYLTVKEIIKKGENIQLFVEIPQTFEEDTIQISSIISIESISGKKLDLDVNIILTTIPISVLISCKEYKLIKEKMNYDNDVTFEQCFKLDTKEFRGDEQINFELLSYKDKEPIEFYLSAKSLENNSSNIPLFSRKKQKDNFKITIPKYEFNSNESDIPRLHCMIEIFVNKNFVIYIIIDALIRPNLNIFKMYDYYSKTFVENEMTIYLNENAQDIFKDEKRPIELKCVLFSTEKSAEFNVVPDEFYGGKIQKYNGKIDYNNKKEFSIFLEFDSNKNSIISSGYCVINISINLKKIQFKLRFSKPETNVFSDDYYLHFKIEGKNNLQDYWRVLKNKEEYIKFYVTPFYYSKSDIDYKNITSPIDGLTFYYINNDGKITSSPRYEKMINETNNLFFKDKYRICFALRYKDSWYPLIKNEGKIGYNIMHFDSALDIKNQVYESWDKWIKKIKTVYNAFNEISRLRDFYCFHKYDDFYKESEKIFNKNLLKGIDKFKDMIKNFKKFSEGENLTFGGLAYHLMFNYLNTIHELNKSIPEDIQKQFELDSDFFYYRTSTEKDDIQVALYNYILKFEKLFNKKSDEFLKLNKKIKVALPDAKEEQKKLLISYYSIDPFQLENKPKILANLEKQLTSFRRDIDNNEEIIMSEKYLIIGNQSNPVNKKEEQKLDNIDDKLNLKLDNSIKMILPEVELKKYKDHLSLNSILELYNAVIIGSRIFPAYLQTSIVNEDNESLKYSSEYFEILYSIYKNTKSNNSSLIYLTINEFIISFKDMIMKLKNAGISFKKDELLNNINLESNNKNSFITPPIKIEPIKQKDDWENKILIEQKINQDFQNDLKKKIEYNNIRAEAIKHIDTTTINISKIEDYNSSDINISNTIIPKKDESEEEDLKFDDILNEI